MLSLGARFRTWKVMKGKYMSDIHQSNLIHCWIVKRGKKDFMSLICELLIFFTQPFTFWNQQVRIFILGGFSPLKGHSWQPQYLFILKLTADLIQVPVEAVCTVTSSGLRISPFGSLQHTPGFSSIGRLVLQSRSRCFGSSCHPGRFLHVSDVFSPPIQGTISSSCVLGPV